MRNSELRRTLLKSGMCHVSLLRLLLCASILCGLLVAFALPANADITATLVVNDPGDAADADTGDGVCDVDLGTPGLQCTLRAAIQEANAVAGFDDISFDLPSGSLLIQPTSPLPQVTEGVVVDGSTQPGTTCPTPLVRLDGALAGASADGLVIAADGSVVSGLIITRFDDAGILLMDSDFNHVSCNLIGTDAAGAAGLGNGGNGIDVFQSDYNFIGEGSESGRNVVAGNGLNGVQIYLSNENSILGNIIGGDPTGSWALPNSSNGVRVVNSSGTKIGALPPERPERAMQSGADNGIEVSGGGNLISGNGAAGIMLESDDSSVPTSTTVHGNWIGVDATGLSAIPNLDGIRVETSSSNVIGGRFAHEGNLISGNTRYGILASDGFDNSIQGNWIGPDATGLAALPNGAGISLARVFDSGNVTVGGSEDGEGNVVSGNTGAGIELHRLIGAVVSGNLIGVGADGLSELGNGGNGITASDSSTTIGGAGIGEGNVIAANGGYGIALDGFLPDAPWARAHVYGNAIGVTPDGSPLYANALGGVLIDDLPGRVDESQIVGNGGNGITVLGSDARVALQRNVIADNAALGIDLGDDGVTPNDPGDGDGGPNLRQNHPVLLAAATINGVTDVDVTFAGLPNTGITVELFSSPTCDPSGHGEGAHYLGFIDLTTDSGGLAADTASLPEAVPLGHFVTATATAFAGAPNYVTSEFSACVVVQAAPPPCVSGPHDGLISADEAWCASDSPHLVTSDVAVAAAVTLVIEPGVVVNAATNSEITVEGHLAAIGTVAQPILFTSSSDSAAARWSGLVFDGGTGDLDYVTVRYGGNPNSLYGECNTSSGTGFNIGMRNVQTGEVRLQNSQVAAALFSCGGPQAADHGLYIDSSRVTVAQTIFSDNGNSASDYAVYVTGYGNVLTFDGNIVRDNRRGLSLTEVDVESLRNNVFIDNADGGVIVGPNTQAEFLHTTLARNGGDAVKVNDGGAVSLVNTIISESTTGVRVVSGGAATLAQTLWDSNATDTVGEVSQSGAINGLAVFDSDGYHLTHFSAALSRGVDAGVPDDIDGEARPLPAGTAPDLGADEYYPVEEFLFGKIALPPQYEVAASTPGDIPSGRLRQRYLLAFHYGSPDQNAAPLPVSVEDTLPAELNLVSETHSPAMSFSQAGQTLTWQTLTPVVRDQSGLIDIETRYETPLPGTVLTNQAVLHAGPFDLTAEAVTQVPLFAPLLVAPGTGELCPGNIEIRGQAQPGVTVHLFINGAPLVQVATDGDGEFSTTYAYGGVVTEALTAQACGVGGACSPLSTAMTLRPPRSFWCPQRSLWEDTPATGPLAGQHLEFSFRDASGEFSSQDWRIPGVLGFHNTILHLWACNCPPGSGASGPPSNVWVIADNVRYEKTGSYPDYTFAITGSAHVVEFWADCGSNFISSSGRILIDPDGYVFDVTQGFDPLDPSAHAVPGSTVTLYWNSDEWGGWTPWPAHLYNLQINPQVTGSDGYFAFFTPPGQYYLQVDGPAGYQPWRSPLITVVNEIVHVNVPYTPLTEPPAAAARAIESVTEVLLTADGPQPANLTVPAGTTVQWRAEIDGLALPADLAEQVANPVLHPLSGINPIISTLGWDGGMLQPGQTYQRQMSHPGPYTYTDGLGHQGQICVDTCTPLAVMLASFEATAQPGAIQVTWETVSELDNAGFNLYRATSDDWGSVALLATVPSQAPGSAQGFAYRYDDTAIQPGQSVWYWLEDVDLNGAITRHGSVSATMQTPTAVTLAQMEATSAAVPPVWPGAVALLMLAGLLVVALIRCSGRMC